MSIATDSRITWSELTTSVINSIKSVCCNIDNFAANVPANIRSGTSTNFNVWDYPTTGSGHNYVQQHLIFKAQNSINLINIVTTSTVNSEWSTFLNSAGLNSHSNKLIQTNELGLAIGLCSQFMAYHLKRIHSRRQLISGLTQSGSTWYSGTGSLFEGTKYVKNSDLGGACTPKYTSAGINSSLPVPTLNNENITETVRQNIINNSVTSTSYNSDKGILNRNGNPVLHRVYLTV